MTLLTNLHVGSANVPDRLRQRHHWVCWDDRDGRKIPIDSRTGDPAKSNDPATWSDFQTATDAADRLKLSGIGYVFSDDDGMVGIDLDECIDDRGKIAEWALVILSRFDSYAEISPSGRGLKLWCIGEIDKGRKHIISKRDSGKSPGIEMYSSGRYFTVTGDRWEGLQDSTIKSCQRDLDWLQAKYWPATPQPEPVIPVPHFSTNGVSLQERAARYLAKIPPAVSGQHGHDRTFHAACVVVLGFGLSPDDAWPVIAEWNQSCEPPWNEADLRRKLDEANKQSGERGWLANGGEYTGSDANLSALLASQESGMPDAQPWAEISSFDVLDLPKFPTHALPDVLRQWVEAESHATQTPADLAALLALSVCSVGIARRVVVEPRLGWREPVNLFTAVLLEPGNRKSAVFADAMKPLRELEAERIEAARPAVAREQSDRRQDEARLRKLEKTAAEKGDSEARHEARNLAANLAEQSEPVLPRLIVDDATAEKLGMMLAGQGGRIASMSPEGGVFDLMAGLYSKSGIPQFGVYLMGHSGDDLITDRVSRESVRVERPALTCAYAMQPAVIGGLAENAAFRGRGLLARFLYAAPQSWIGRREIAPAPVSEATREAYRQAVRAMAEVKGEFVLQLSADAAALFREWEAEIEAMLAEGGRMEIMRDWGAKLAGATLRLAAVLHCVEHGPAGQIEGRTIAAAVEIALYLIPHAEAVLNMMMPSEKPADDDARYVLRWIERHGWQKFTKSEAQHHGKRRFPKAADIDPALAELTERGYIRPRPFETTGPGRPPSPTFDVNPATFADAKPEKRSHNSRNSSGERENSNSRNIGNALEQSETTRRERVTI